MDLLHHPPPIFSPRKEKVRYLIYRYDLSMEKVLEIRKMEGKGEITNLMGEKRERGNKN